MKLLFHAHTNYSKDCLISLDSFRKKCLQLGVVPTITDHNTIAGAQAYVKRFGKQSCIVGEEIKTLQGEVIGLYVKQEVAAGLDIFKTLNLLQKQKAIIVVPHPFDRLRTSRLGVDINLLNKRFKIHFIETFNSRTVFRADNLKAQDYFALNKHEQRYLSIAGADSHTAFEMSNCYNQVADFDITSREQFIRSLSHQGEPFTRKSTLLVHALTKLTKLLRRC